jgi:hypothetical protein
MMGRIGHVVGVYVVVRFDSDRGGDIADVVDAKALRQGMGWT